MEDQGKRLLLAVVIAFGIMMAWSMLFPPEKREEEPEKPGTGEVAQGDGDGGAATATGPGAPGATRDGGVGAGSADQPGTAPGKEPGEAAAPPVKPGQASRPDAVEYTFDFDNIKAVFSSHSGALTSWELQGKKFRDRAAGGKRQTDLAPTGNTERFPSKGLGVDLFPFTIGFSKDSTYKIPAKSHWTRVHEGEREIHYEWTSEDGHLTVVKQYKLIPEDYLLQLTVVAKLSEGEAKQSLVISSFGYQDPNATTGGKWTRVDTSWRTACYVSGGLNTNSAKYLERGPKVYPGRVQWAGFAHSYFLAAFSPKPDVENQFECVASRVKDAPPGTMRLDLVYGTPVELGEGRPLHRAVSAYLGPKYLDKLDSISGIVDHDTGFENSIDLGWFAFIARPLLWLLSWFQTFVINWGIAIILLTFVVKGATLYWTTKSMRSMKAMADLKPEVEKIQKKHKDDKQRQQVEIMAMYKAHKVSPLSGCLPMLLQMPIWFALYKTLMVAAELYQAPFIPGWIDDLTTPDPFYIMPVALMGMMFLQSKLSPTAADSMQQKIMMYGLPLMFGVFSLFFPAGLTLYILTNTSLTALHHVWLHRSDDKKKAAAAAAGGKPRITAADDDSSGPAKSADTPVAVPDDDDDEADGNLAGNGGRGTGANRPRKSKKSGPRKRGAQRKKGGKRKRSA